MECVKEGVFLIAQVLPFAAALSSVRSLGLLVACYMGMSR